MEPLSEYLECKIFVAWLKAKKLRFSHLPMSTFTRSIKQRVRNKEMGVQRGVPDYVVVTGQKVLFVELKRVKKGRPSPEQIEWVKELNSSGCPAKVCYGAQEAIDFVGEFL